MQAAGGLFASLSAAADRQRPGRLGKKLARRRALPCTGAELRIGVVTNGIYTSEDALFLRGRVYFRRAIIAVKPAAAAQRSGTMSRRTSKRSPSSAPSPTRPRARRKRGGDNLTAIFSPALAGDQIFVIDKRRATHPRKGGPESRAATCW